MKSEQIQTKHDGFQHSTVLVKVSLGAAVWSSQRTADEARKAVLLLPLV